MVSTLCEDELGRMKALSSFILVPSGLWSDDVFGALLFAGVGFQPQCDQAFCNAKHFLNIGERCCRVIIVVHQTVVVISVCRDFIDNEARFLERRATMIRFTADFICCHLQCAIQAEGPGSRGTFAVIGAIPFRWRVEYLTRALHDL